MTNRCVYATSGWGVHDERWVEALRSIGRTPQVVSLGREAADPTALRAQVLAVAEASDGTTPVLAGPLHTVTRHLVDLPVPVIGLSWGYDVEALAAEEAGLAWLHRLSGLIVDSLANKAACEAAGVPTDRITFLPWGIDLADFPAGGALDTMLPAGVPTDAPLIVSLRAHEKPYRVRDIVDALPAVLQALVERPEVDAPWLVIGHSGSLTDQLREQAQILGVAHRVRWIGTLTEREVSALLGRAVVYVTASQVDGTSVTLLQAMARGAPVVASDTPGNLGWITDGVTGFTFTTGDVDDLARALVHALTVDTRPVTQAARALVERDADWAANLGRLAEALERT